MHQLSETEVGMVSGGNPIVFVRNALIGGAIYDGAKGVAGWIGSTFFARDGSSGSRYYADLCHECS